MNDAANDFVCPRCFDRSCVATTCIRCGNIDMLPAVATPTDGSVPTVERAHRVATERSAWRAVLTTLCSLALLVPSVARFAVRARFGHELPLLTASFALLAVVHIISFFDLFERVDIRDLRRCIASLYPDVRRTRISEAVEGLVRIAGVGQLIVQHLTPEGVPSLAYRSNLITGRGPSPIPLTMNVDAGCFAISDGSGINALVSTRWIEIDGATARDGSINIAPGSMIEVTGYARRVPVTDGVNGGLRRAPEILEFAGTPDQPVVIRVMSAKEVAECARTAPNQTSAACETGAVAEYAHASTITAPPVGVRVAIGNAVPHRVDEVAERAAIPSMHRSVRV
jgi:hypothetical protein